MAHATCIAFASLWLVCACSFDVGGLGFDIDASSADANGIDAPSAPALVGRELISRYYLDEATMGQVPSLAFDSAPEPLNLALGYSGAEPSYVEIEGNRGLEWTTPAGNGAPTILIDGTKITTALDGSKTGTIEVVFRFDAVSSQATRISHIGFDNKHGRFTLSTVSLDTLFFRFNDVTSGEWQIDFKTAPVVVHMVLDTNQPDADSRTRLYVDGIEQTLTDPAARPSQGAGLSFNSDESFAIGNRAIGGRAGDGEIFYVAMYSSALTLAEISSNVTVLAVSDDTP